MQLRPYVQPATSIQRNGSESRSRGAHHVPKLGSHPRVILRKGQRVCGHLCHARAPRMNSQIVAQCGVTRFSHSQIRWMPTSLECPCTIVPTVLGGLAASFPLMSTYQVQISLGSRKLRLLLQQLRLGSLEVALQDVVVVDTRIQPCVTSSQKRQRGS